MSLKNDPVESMEQERLCASEDMQRSPHAKPAPAARRPEEGDGPR